MPDTLEPASGGRYPGDMESRVAVLEEIARSLAGAQDRVERRFDGFERRFDAIERRFDSFERRLDMLSARHQSDFRWLLGVMLGGFGAMFGGFTALLGVMAHGFHWL